MSAGYEDVFFLKNNITRLKMPSYERYKFCQIMKLVYTTVIKTESQHDCRVD